MGYVNKVQIGNNTHLVEPTLYIAPTLSSSAYSATLTNFVLTSGVTVYAKFAATNPANATLNVNSTGAKEIWYNNAKITGNILKVNHTYALTYDGTEWQLIGDIDTNTHYSANIYTTGDSGTSAITTDTNDPYIALIENSTRRSAVQIKAGTNISVKGNNGIITINNTYSHPTGDGNLHVPATGTSNNGKFLKAGSTAGSLSWGTAVTSITIKTTGPLTGGSNTATTTTGTYTIAFSNQNANTILAGPSSGNAAAPSFRSLVLADIPTITNEKLQNSNFTLGATSISLGSTCTSINGPFTVYTTADSEKGFGIGRTSTNEIAVHWVNDQGYHIDYTNDETASSLYITLTNTDTERATNKGADASSYTYIFSHTGAITGASFSGNATTCTYPLGFTSRTASASWGNTTGTSFTSWNDSTGGSIDFRRDNPSSGKMSLKVDGRFYFNEGNTPVAGLKSANNYWGMTGPDGEDNVWIRTTSQGIIPYQSGGASAGHCQLGTETWYFSKAYIQNIYGTLNGNASTATNFAAAKNIALTGDITGNADGGASGGWSIATTIKSSVALTGTPTAPTAADETNTTQIATTAFVHNTLKYVNAMVFRGTLGTNGTITALPNTHDAGDTYRVITPNTYPIVDSDGRYCETGTLIICIKDGTVANPAEWTAVETNEDGAVIGPSSSTANQIAKFSSNTGRVITNSNVTIDNSNNITVPGTIYFGTNTSSGKAMFSYNSTYPKYGIWYFDESIDKMTFSASGNANSKTEADFGINVHGAGTLTNRNNRIPHTGNTTGSVGSTTTPVYIEDGEIKTCTAYANASVNYATSAGKATNDGNGDAITTTYIKNGLLTTKGDIIYASKANTPARLAIGTAGYFLKATANGPVWSNTTNVAISLTNTTASTSTITGALTVDGGVGVDGRITAAEVNATRAMVVKSGKVYSNISSADVLLPAKTTMMFANGIAIANPGLAGANDVGWIRVTGTAETDTVLEIATGDDGGSGEQIVARQYNTSNAVVHEAVLLSKTGATTFPVSVTAPSFVGALTGNVTGNVSGTAANVTGTVAIAHGGTGLTQANPHEVLIGPQTETVAAPTWRMIDNNDIAPIASQKYSAYTCSEANEAKGSLIFGKITITDTTYWPAPWAIHYRVYVSTTEANTQGWYDCYFSVSGSTVCYYNYNNFYSTDYRPIYYHKLIYPKNTYSSYGAFFGVNLFSSSTAMARNMTSLARIYTVEILETKNCTIELYGTIRRFDEVFVTTNSIAAGTIWNNGNYNAQTVGLQESGDTNSNDTGYYILSNGFRMIAGDSPNKVYRYTLFGRVANGKYESFVTSSTIDATKTKNTHGFLPDGKIYWNSNNADYAGATSASIYEQYHSIDYRYTFNISTTGIPANAQTYIVFTYNRNDGLLYLADNWFTTTPNTTGYIYQRIGNNYYGSADYRGSLLLENPYYIYDGTDLQVWHPYAEVSKFTASVALYEPRATTTTLNKSANYVAAGAMFHLVASSSTSATDNGKTPTDANILQMNWDNNGGYDAQLGISTSGCRMYFRSRASTKEAWQEVAHAPAGNAVGDATTPIYMSATGVLIAGTALGTSSVQNEEYFVKAITSTDNAIVRYNGTSGQVQDSTATIDDNGNLSIKGTLNLNRKANIAYGRISFYDPAYYTWFDYMASNENNGSAPTTGKPSSLGNVTTWARRSLIESSANYGWIWEASTNIKASANTTTPTARMALSSNTGQLRIAPSASSTSCESGGLIIDSAKNGSSGNVAIELWRGNNVASWQIANDGGTLYFRNNYTTQNTYSETSLSIASSTGNATFSGSVTASSFSGALTGNVTGNITGNAGSAGAIAAKLAATTKTYLLGTSTTITSTAANVELSGDTYVYLDVTAGSFSASRHYLNITGTEKAYIEYNSSDNAIDFVFL